MSITHTVATLPPTDPVPPRTWLVIGDKLGDNAQIDLIAEALGWPCERKPLVFLERYVFGKPRFKPSLYHLDRDRSALLAPPWPDLILTIGRRPSMAALWIRQQSGGHSQVVLLGRPKRLADAFALIIAPTQYRLPDRANVLPLALPLMRSDTAAIAAATATWQARLADLPRPLTALLVGGQTKPFRLDTEVTDQLLAQVTRLLAESGGTLYVSTSRRTPPAVVERLRHGLPAGAPFYGWTPASQDNPYLGLLGLADRFIVTGDSVSMLVEVARLGKPLAIFPLPVQRNGWQRWRQTVLHWLTPDSGRRGPLAALGQRLYRLGVFGYARDLTAIHRLLIERGLAVQLGTPFLLPRAPLAGELSELPELPQVVARIRALLAAA
jgi:mitochondrial fission protein ELM1